jgi:hypothetical protein
MEQSQNPEKLTGFQLVKKFPAFYGIRKFITPFTSARHLSLSKASLIHSIPPHPTCWSSIHNIILPSTPGSPKWSPSLRLPYQNSVYACALPHSNYMPHPSYSSLFYHPNNIGWGIEIIKLLIMWFSPLPCYIVPLTYLLTYSMEQSPSWEANQ